MLALVNAFAATEPPVRGQPSAFANDSWMSSDGKFLYQDYAGDDRSVVCATESNGSLTKITEQSVNAASKISLQGLTGI